MEMQSAAAGELHACSCWANTSAAGDDSSDMATGGDVGSPKEGSSLDVGVCGWPGTSKGS